MIDHSVAEVAEFDMVRAFLYAQAAVVAWNLVLCDMQNLQGRSCVEDFEKVTKDAECSQKYGPWKFESKDAGHIPCPEEDSDPYPEL